MDSSIAACDSKASIGRNAHGSHMAAVRSLGLLHDLQEYVATLQQTAVEQEKELSKLEGEKKEVERVLKKELRAPEKQPYLQHFQASEIADLPPRLRALFEDNKVLKEQIRRYKQRAQDAERQAAQQEQQLLGLTEQVKKLKGQLAEGAGSPEAQAAEELVRQQADANARALEKLQDAHRVLQLKLDTDARMHKQALASAAKERHQLEQQLDELQQQLDEKDKEARANALAAKQAQRKLEEIKGSAAKAVAGVNVRVAEAVAAEAAKHKQLADARVHLMLCIIKDTNGSSTRGGHLQQQQQQQPCQASTRDVWSDSDHSAAADAAGASSRPDLRYGRDEAVLLLQAGARGYLTRKRLRQQREREEHAAVLIQAGARGMRARKQVHGLLSQQQLQDPLAAFTYLGSSNTSSSSGGSAVATRLAASTSPAAAAGGSSSSGSSSSLPMELPALQHAGAAANEPAGAKAAGTGGAAAAATGLVAASPRRPAAAAGAGAAMHRRTSSLLAAAGANRKIYSKSPAPPPRSAATAQRPAAVQRQAGSASPRIGGGRASSGSKASLAAAATGEELKGGPAQQQRQRQRLSLQAQPPA